MNRKFVLPLSLVVLLVTACQSNSKPKKKPSASSGAGTSNTSVTLTSDDPGWDPPDDSVSSVTPSGTSATSATSSTPTPTSITSATPVPPTPSTSTVTSVVPPTPTSSTSTTPVPDPYYEACEGLTGSDLQAKLKQINPAKNPSYDWSRYEDADEAEDDSTCILSIYTRHNIKKNSHCGSYAWDKWNREHIWTQSAFPMSSSDNHNIFACEGQINNIRNNYKFAEGGSVVEVFGHVTGCRFSGSTFEPCDEAKGEVARAVMYGTVMYSYTMTDEIESIYLALKWHLQHPITTRDTKRNEVVYGNQGNRNPFVDHPEYACRIWGATNNDTKALCGMN